MTRNSLVPHTALTNLLLLGFVGWIVVALIIGVSSSRDGSLRIADRGAIISFRRRPGDRICWAMMSVWIILGVLFQYGLGIIDAVQHHKPVPDWAYFALFIGVLMGGGFGGLLLYWAGPCDLILDRDRRTYRFLSGWPLFPRVQTGPWEDMAGVSVRRIARGTKSAENPHPGYYKVEIAWRQERRACPLLGDFHREEEADALAEEMTALLGLPRVVPPPEGKTSVNPATSTFRKKIAPPPFRPFRPMLFASPALTEAADTEQPTLQHPLHLTSEEPRDLGTQEVDTPGELEKQNRLLKLRQWQFMGRITSVGCLLGLMLLGVMALDWRAGRGSAYGAIVTGTPVFFVMLCFMAATALRCGREIKRLERGEAMPRRQRKWLIWSGYTIGILGFVCGYALPNGHTHGLSALFWEREGTLLAAIGGVLAAALEQNWP